MPQSLTRIPERQPRVMAHACSPGTQEAEGGGSQVGGQPELCSEFKTSLNYTVRPSQDKTKYLFLLR